MLSAKNLSKSFGVETLFQGASFSLKSGEHFGLIGPNGCGKTTLLRILAGQEKPDHGSVQFTPPSLPVGYLPQGFEFAPGETIAQFLARMEGDLPALSTRLEQLAADLAHHPGQPALQREVDDILVRMEIAAQSAGRGPSALAALGLAHLEAGTLAANLSGGQKTRLALAGVLLSSPQFLLLDEPTNHLDLDMLNWLENWLQHFEGAALVVSHDRAFLDQFATGILELNAQHHDLHQYSGNFSAYLAQKGLERERQRQEYSDQNEEISRLRASAAHLRGIATFRKGGKADGGDKLARGFFANRGLATVGRAKHIEKRLEHLLTDERVEKPRPAWQLKIEFGETPASGRDVLVLEDLAVGYGQQPLLSAVSLVVTFGSRVALVGPNGCGKTTLLRTVAGLIPPLKGTTRLGSKVRPGIMAQEQENLNPQDNALTDLKRILSQNETEVRSFLSKFLFTGDDVFTPIARLSYGERARLELARLVAAGCNFLMLDEPINHLDIAGRERFEQALSAFQGTVLAVVHDRYFIERFATELWEVSDGRIVPQGRI